MNVAAKCIDGIKRFEAPVLTQEMRIRQRGAKPYWVMFVYVLVLIVSAMLTYAASVPNVVNSGQGQEALSRIGRSLFQVMAMVQLVLIVLVVPAYSSASVSSERERGTIDMLSLTLLSSGSIIRQKLAAAVVQVLTMILASLPVVAVAFLLGGVAPYEVIVVYLILASTAVLLSAVGMTCSCCARKTQTSTFLAYLVPILAFVGVPICLSWMESIGTMGLDRAVGRAPLIFTLGFAITGAIPALAVYGFVALVLGHRWTWWKTRACRMAVFGLTYALLLFILSYRPLVDALIGSSTFNVLEILNPFQSVGYFISMQSSSSSVYSPWMAAVTIGAFLGMAYILERISAMRFNALRRA